jgi:hypothetical protein
MVQRDILAGRHWLLDLIVHANEVSVAHQRIDPGLRSRHDFVLPVRPVRAATSAATTAHEFRCLSSCLNHVVA